MSAGAMGFNTRTPRTPGNTGTPETPRAAGRFESRHGRKLVAGGAVVALAATAGFALGGGSGAGARPATTGPVKTRTAEVVRTTLTETEELDGTLGYGDTTSVPGGRGGTVTRLPGEGAVIERGDEVYEVDGRPVPLLYGDRPAWRTLGEGMSDGLDVRQLEEELVALGYASRAGLGVDNHFGAPTTAALKRFQKARGLVEDGVLDPGEAIFLPGAARVAEHRAFVGAPAQGEILTVTSAERIVTSRLDANRQDLLARGDTVHIELPDGTRIPAKVTSVGTVAQAAEGNGFGGGSSTVDVVVTPDDATATGRLDGAPVTVHVTRGQAEDVLAVPVASLLALSEGGYAVEVQDTGGKRRLVGVETGMFQGGLVEVTGAGIAAGDHVVVPV